MRLPLSSNAAGLKIGVQALDVTGSRDETHIALAEVVKLTLGNLSWRRDAARVVVLVGDATPIDGADTLSPQQVVSALEYVMIARLEPSASPSLSPRSSTSARQISAQIRIRHENDRVQHTTGRATVACRTAGSSILLGCTARKPYYPNPP